MSSSLHRLTLAFVLFLASSWALYYLAPRWPFVVAYSDFHSLGVPDPMWRLSREPTGWPLTLSRGLLSGCVGGLLSSVSLFRRDLTKAAALSISVLLVAAVMLLTYPLARSLCLAGRHDGEASIFVEFGGSPIQLELRNQRSSYELTGPQPNSWFVGAKLCQIEFKTGHESLNVARETGLLSLPPVLELESTFPHDLVRITIVSEEYSNTVLGVRGGGRHSRRVNRILDRMSRYTGLADLNVDDRCSTGT